MGGGAPLAKCHGIFMSCTVYTYIYIYIYIYIHIYIERERDEKEAEREQRLDREIHR